MRSVATAGLAALAVAMGIGRFAFTPILPMMQDDAGLSLAAGGWLAAANYLGYFAGALTTMRLRLSPRTAIRCALVAISATTLAMGLHEGLAYWLVLRTIAGVASAWVLVFVSTWALRRLAHGGVVFAGVGIGIAFAGVACLILMNIDASSKTAWVALGAASFLVTALLWNAFDADKAVAPAPSPSPGRRNWTLVVCYGAFGFGYIVPATFLPAMAREIVRDPALFGWAWPVFGVAAALSTLYAGRFPAQRRVWIAASVLMAIGVLLPLALPGIQGIVGAALLVGGTFVVITMAGMQEARRIAPHDARALMGAMTSAFAFGQVAGPLMVSFGASTTLSLAVSAALLLASAIALAFSAAPNRSLLMARSEISMTASKGRNSRTGGKARKRRAP